jgi:hypothetical protein
MDILALDLSKASTGWARWDGISPRPTYGSIKLGGEYANRLDTYRAFHKFWLEVRLFKDPEYVSIEAPANPKHLKHNTKFDNDRKLIGLAEVAWYFCMCMGLSHGAVREVPVQGWRGPFIGPQKRGPEKPDLKAMTIRRCKQLGLPVANSDEADAIGLLTHEIQMRGGIPPWMAHEQLALDGGGA